MSKGKTGPDSYQGTGSNRNSIISSFFLRKFYSLYIIISEVEKKKGTKISSHTFFNHIKKSSHKHYSFKNCLIFNSLGLKGDTDGRKLTEQSTERNLS